jgi:hypothetical protein
LTVQGQAPEDQAERSRRALRRRLEDQKLRLRQLREQRAGLRELDIDRQGHNDALVLQAGRVGLAAALPDDDHGDEEHCVLCGAGLTAPDETASALARAARELERQITEMTGAARDVSAAERALDEEIAALTAEAEQTSARLEAAADADDAAREGARRAEEQAYLRGVIAEHLRIADLAGEDPRPRLIAAVTALRAEVATASEGLDPTSVRERVDDRLDAMADDMTRWARELDLEWAKSGLVRIDRQELNVTVKRPEGRLSLRQIGSGGNHVGYHLVAHLALHKYFIELQRPVPRFLILDQPSLPYFANATDKDAAAGDVDWLTVKQLFELTQRVVNDLEGALQVLITDHASYKGEDWYDDALVADWHDGEKLVPEDWPTADV